ncbi:hypothetical protein AB4395_00355 [Vibrio splendidus]
MDTYELVKHATSLAKSKKYDEAIDFLNQLYETNDMSDSDIIKIIPYYQKSGRYGELESYCIETLIPLISSVNERTFLHKCKEIQHAFISLSIYKIYNKLELCAKREKIEADKSKFSSKAVLYYQLYEINLAKGEEIELKLEYLEAKNI